MVMMVYVVYVDITVPAILRNLKHCILSNLVCRIPLLCRDVYICIFREIHSILLL